VFSNFRGIHLPGRSAAAVPRCGPRVVECNGSGVVKGVVTTSITPCTINLLQDPRLEQLERILASAGFAQSDRLSRFLRHVVEETVAGRESQIKETTIGVEVFGKPAGFDPEGGLLGPFGGGQVANPADGLLRLAARGW
jgi:hypothetical protein